MHLSMDHVALVGYATLLAFAVYKLKDTQERAVDLLANVLLLVGLSSLIAYHARLIRTHKDEATDETQRRLRLLAHTSLVMFLLLTLSSYSAAKFQRYDWLALAGHASLFVSVWLQRSQLFGVGCLALYFLFATLPKFGQSGAEVLNLLGRGLLALYFVVAFARGATAS